MGTLRCKLSMHLKFEKIQNICTILKHLSTKSLLIPKGIEDEPYS
jgi:hypothetical protein